MNEKIFESVGWLWGYATDKKVLTECCQLLILLKEEEVKIQSLIDSLKSSNSKLQSLLSKANAKIMKLEKANMEVPQR